MVSYNNYTIKNNVFGTLSAPISSLATTIQLNSWQWARFAVNQLATLENIEDWKVKKREIVLITAIAWDVLTVTRKVAPCPANDEANTQWQVSYAFSADDTISAYITKEHFDKIDDSINDIYDNWVNKLRTEVISWLQIKVNAWPVLVWSSYYDFAWWNLTLTDNATNYIEIDEDWNLVSNTTWRTLENSKVSKVITSWWEITSIEDWRLWTVWWKIWWTDIHELTEKTNLANDDEFIIADSENIRQNKKIKAESMWFMSWTLPAWENISKWNVLFIENMISTVDDFDAVWFDNNVQKVSIKRVWNWMSFSQIQMYLWKQWTPTNDLSVRIETDDNWKPSWTLVDENAYWTVSQSDLTTSVASTTISLAWTITIAKWTVCHIVIWTSSVSSTNYYIYWWKLQETRLFNVKQYDWANRNDWTNNNKIYDIENYLHISDFNSWWNWSWYCFWNKWQYLYVMTATSNTVITWYTLSTPYDVSTATANLWTFTSVSNNWNYNIWISDDWKYLRFSKNYSSTTMRYVIEMSTPRNLSTATQKYYKYRDNISTTWNQWFSIGMNWTKLYSLTYWYYSSDTYVAEFNLTTPYDVSTASLVIRKNFYTRNEDCWIFVSNDWKYLFLYSQSNWYITKYEMTTPWSVDTISNKKQVSLSTKWYSISFSEDWTRMLTWWYNQSARSYVSSRNVWKNFWEKVFQYSQCDWLFDSEVWKASASNNLFVPPVPMTAYRDVNTWKIVNYNFLFDKNQSWLTPNQKYYLSDTAWEISNTTWTNEFEVWIAIEPTILKLKQTY